MQERRKKLRYDVTGSNRLIVDGKSFECSVTDVGMGGVLLSTDGDLSEHVSVGSSGELRGPLETMFSGKIVRVESGLVAIKADANSTNENYLLDTIFHEGD